MDIGRGSEDWSVRPRRRCQIAPKPVRLISMTAYRCWLEFPTDRSLITRVKRGEFGDAPPISEFPPRSSGSAWPSVLLEWSRIRGLDAVNDGLVVSVSAKKEMVEDFITFVYDKDSMYSDPARMLTWQGRAYLAHRLTDLRAFVAQQLSPRLRYLLKADEF